MKFTHALTSICICLAVLSCQKESESVKVTGITISASAITMTEGDTQTLSASVSPSTADNKNISWSSSDTAVASVVDGKVTAMKAGTATITARSDDGGKTATCSVTVNAKYIPVESLTLDRVSLTVNVGSTSTLTATVLPDNATDRTVSWTSSDESVVKVDGTGRVTAVGVGTAVVSAKVEEKTASCNFTVVYNGDNEDINYEDWII